MIYLISSVSVLIFLYVLHLFLVIKFNKHLHRVPKVIMQIKVSKNNEKSAVVAEHIFSTLHSATVPETFINWFLGKKSQNFSFEIASINQHLYFYVWVPKKMSSLVKGQLYAQYPDIEIQIVDDYASIKTDQAVCAELETSDPYIYPIKRHPEFEDKVSMSFFDPLSAITSTISQLYATDEQMWIQIVVSPLDSSWRHRGNWVAQKISEGFWIQSPDYQVWYTKMLLKRGFRRVFYFPIRMILSMIGLSAKKAIRTSSISSEVEKSHGKETIDHAVAGKMAQFGFHTNIRFVYIPRPENKAVAENKLKEVMASFYQFNIPRFNSFVPRVVNKNNSIILKRYKNRSMVKPFILCLEEVATLWHLPNITVETPNIQWVMSKKLEAPLNIPLQKNITPDNFSAVGSTNFRGENNLFGIKTIDRRRHIYIIGKTGMGKSTILENMIFSDIQNGKGLAVVDPHGDLAEAIISFVPKSRTNDVIIFDPSDIGYPVSFNMLECKNPENRHLIASGLLGVFKKMFGESWGPRMEHILRNTLLALTYSPGSTMLGIMKILTDDKYRSKVLNKVTDPIVLDFWHNEFGKWQPKQITENVSPIQNKVGQFLSAGIIRNILGQPKSSIDLRFAMDKKKIIIINLSKGKIGEDNSALLGAMIITKFQLDAMSRADIAEKERKDFYLYVDEFQNFATDSFATILSEARKYKLNLTMANQYIAQMPETVRDAVFGNVGSTICCQVGADDAEYLSAQFSEEVSSNDIVNLPKYQSYIRLMIDGIPSKIFSANNLPPPKFHDDPEQKERIIKVCRERYAKKRAFVEEKISQWTQNPK